MFKTLFYADNVKVLLISKFVKWLANKLWVMELLYWRIKKPGVAYLRLFLASPAFSRFLSIFILFNNSMTTFYQFKFQKERRRRSAEEGIQTRNRWVIKWTFKLVLNLQMLTRGWLESWEVQETTTTLIIVIGATQDWNTIKQKWFCV